MKTYSCFDAPLKVFGVPFFEQKKKLIRLSDEVLSLSKGLDSLGRRCPGARVGFKTDADAFGVRVTLETLNASISMSIYACQSLSVMIGDRQNAAFAGLVNPPDYQTKTFERTIAKSAQMQEITLWLPRNERVANVEVILPDEAAVLPPSPYKYGPALYYGSSITEGGCCCNITNAYNALLSRWLDLDYYNFGFSGYARGELEMADLINTVDMRVFVLDYDHNAPTPEHLAATHEPFFKRVREKHPDLPILMLSSPGFDYSGESAIRRSIIRKTYENAVASGDKHVYFIDGETLFGREDRHCCTIDKIHPNDLGMYRMAKTVLPVMKTALGIN